MNISKVLPSDGMDIKLDELSNADRELFEVLYCDKATMRNISETYHSEQIPDIFQRCLNTDQKPNSLRRFYIIVEKKSGLRVGVLSRVPTYYPEAPVELGIMLTAPARGLGYADQALASLCLFCFITLEVENVLVRFNPYNKGARQLNIRLGFTDAPAHYDDKSGLLCWWLNNTPQIKQKLHNICSFDSMPLQNI